MSKYFEGYYCKDDSSVDGIRTETSRQVLRRISRHYPLGVTVDEISKQTEIPPDTVQWFIRFSRRRWLHKKKKIWKAQR